MQTKPTVVARKSPSQKRAPSTAKKKKKTKKVDRRRKRAQESFGITSRLLLALGLASIIQGFLAFHVGKLSISVSSFLSKKPYEVPISASKQSFVASSKTPTAPSESSLSSSTAKVSTEEEEETLLQQPDNNISDIEDARDPREYTNPIFALWDNTTLPTAFLDDYYSRRHSFPRHDSGEKSTTAFLSSFFGTDRSELPILIVGGSDGSGTRVVVETLQRLGVPMVVDDDETMDIHLSCLNMKRRLKQSGCPIASAALSRDPVYRRGWPLLVHHVMKKMRSVQYQWNDFSSCDRAMIEYMMVPCLDYYKKKAENLTSSWGMNVWNRHAMSIQYGFKAPVSMLLLPILLRLFGRIKFLHVVRDGRDVCLSSNTSPVDKFYGSFFANATGRERDLMNWAQQTTGVGTGAAHPVMAIQLWNDWNVQLLEWERSMVTKNKTNRSQRGKQEGLESAAAAAGQPMFDYMVVRTEDLIDPATRLAIVHQMADFVGSQKSAKDICCVAQQSTTDMGQSGLFLARKRKRARQQGSSSNQTEPRNIQHELQEGDAKEFLRKNLELRENRTGHEYPQAMSHEIQPMNEKEKIKQEMYRHRGERIADEHRFRTAKQKAHFQRLREHYRNAGFTLFDLTHRRVLEVPEDIAMGNVSSVNITVPPSTRSPPAPLPSNAKALSKLRKDKFIEAFHEQHRALEMEKKKLDREATDQVRKRYGKWMTMLQAYPELRDALGKEAARGLEAFGYESSTPFADFTRALQHSCDLELKCPEQVAS